MASSATLSTLTTRCQNLLNDTGAVIFASVLIQEGLRLALEEYNTVKAQDVVGTVTPASGDKLFSLSSLTGLLDVKSVWFPYRAANPEDPENYLTNWWLVFDAGVPKLNVGDDAPIPDATLVARIFYTKPHTLNGLDSATTSTFPAIDDGLLVRGACGHACLMVNTSTPVPEIYQIGLNLLKSFREQLGG